MKNFILDTNVLLLDPNSIFKFEDNIVTIPIGVIEELDSFKKDSGELGKNARQVSRSLDNLREEGALKEGVKSGESLIRVRYNGNLGSYKKEVNVDLHVIHIAQLFLEEEPNVDTIIVSDDINIRIRADALGVKAQKYRNNTVDKSIDRGYFDAWVKSRDFKEFDEQGYLFFDDLFFDDKAKLFANHYVTLIGEKEKRLGRIDIENRCVKKLHHLINSCKIHPLNKEQAFAMDALLVPASEIPLVSLCGIAGCGKTLLACAAGYDRVLNEKSLSRLMVARPIMPMGKDLGALPGDLSEKLDPWMAPIYDAFEVIHGGLDGKQFVEHEPKIKVEPLSYIRGRSVKNQFFIIDECQNLNKLEVKTILTRAGEGTKIVLTGDIDQIDNPYLSRDSNGLSFVMEQFQESRLAAHVMLTKGVRSPLAEEASERL